MSQTTSKAKLPKQKVSQSLLGSSELIRKLQNLLDKDLPQSQTRFSERLTQNMDFTSSLKLSEVHGHLRLLEKKTLVSSATEPTGDQKRALNSAFERVRCSIEKNIEQSFDLSIEQPRFPLPRIDLEKQVPDLSAYQKFYQAQQSEMSAKIQGLRTFVRETLSASSVNMAKLALLDTTLEETIGFTLRSGFAALSKVISKYSQKIEAQWSEDDKLAQLSGFHNELHQLLAAELELRLQPIQGLINAFNQEVS
tara:strand:+ start:765 stop:1520 length:756 start_codon:yes stop_codon:yes gene_type:complete